MELYHVKPLQNTKIQNQKKSGRGGGVCRVSGIRMNWESLINPKIRGKKLNCGIRNMIVPLMGKRPPPR